MRVALNCFAFLFVQLVAVYAFAQGGGCSDKERFDRIQARYNNLSDRLNIPREDLVYYLQVKDACQQVKSVSVPVAPAAEPATSGQQGNAEALARARVEPDMRAGQAALNRNAFDDAISAYGRAINASSGLAKVDIAIFYYQRAYAYMYKPNPDYAKAMSDLNQSIQLSPLANAFVNRGHVWWTGYADYDRAVADFKQAARLDPKMSQDVNRLLAKLDQQRLEVQREAAAGVNSPVSGSTGPTLGQRAMETQQRQRREACAAYWNNPNRSKFSNPCN